MNKHVQIRNLPDPQHRKLKERAASQGLTITDYVKRLIESDLKRPSLAEMAERLRQLPPVTLDPSPEALIRADRDTR